jgi:peptidoglycan-N-acetylglucosamine deacetylase
VSDGSPFRVALTFDAEHADRPTDPGMTAAILGALAVEGVAASFFVQGRWVEAEPALAARIARDGHLVGNHSHHHARMTMLTRSGLERDVRAAEAAIRSATGLDPRPWFRCPFGAGADSARVVGRLAALGYVDVGWHVDGRDWAGGSLRALEARVLRGAVAHGDGAVILLHGWPVVTARTLPRIIEGLLARGATFVRADALEAVPGRRVAPGATAGT